MLCACQLLRNIMRAWSEKWLMLTPWGRQEISSGGLIHGGRKWVNLGY